jgi:hypothetical protein
MSWSIIVVGRVQYVLIFSVFVNACMCVLMSCGDFVKNWCKLVASGKRVVSGHEKMTWFSVWIPVWQMQSLCSLAVRLWRPFSIWRLCDPVRYRVMFILSNSGTGWSVVNGLRSGLICLYTLSLLSPSSVAHFSIIEDRERLNCCFNVF